MSGRIFGLALLVSLLVLGCGSEPSTRDDSATSDATRLSRSVAELSGTATALAGALGESVAATVVPDTPVAPTAAPVPPTAPPLPTATRVPPTPTPTAKPIVVIPPPTVASNFPPPSSSGLEEVYVVKLLDSGDDVIVRRKNGSQYVINYGIGCLGLWRYESKYIMVSSPGIFAGVSSKLVLPNGDTCRIWNAEQI